MKKFLSLALGVSLLALTVAACDPVREEKGYRLDQEQVVQLEPGTTNKDKVLELMGSPSSISTFPQAGEAWYYIGKKTAHFAFFEKKILEQNVTVIVFDQNEVIKSIKNYDKDDARDVDVVDRTTPTGGNELGFFEQMFGNFGRFNPGQ